MVDTPELRILQWNVRSLAARLTDLRHLVSVFIPHVLILCETWLHHSSSVSLPGFTLFREDRAFGPRGGVAVAVRSDLCASKVDLPVTRVEAVAVNLVLKGGRLTFLSLYEPERDADRSGDLDRILSGLGGPVVVGGDLNSRNEAWGSPTTTSAGQAIQDLFTLRHGLHLLNDGSPTCFPAHAVPSHLDVSFCCSSLALRTSWRTLASSASDHAPVLVTVAGLGPRDRPRAPRRTPDWAGFSRRAAALLPPPSLPLDALALSLSAGFFAAAFPSSPLPRPPSRPPLPPWWSSAVRKAVAERNTARHRALRCPCPDHGRAYRIAYARARLVVREARRSSWRAFCSSLSPSSSSLSRVWRLAKGRPPSSAIPPLSDPRGFLAVSALERSSSLLHAFFPPTVPNQSSVLSLQVIPFSYLCDTRDLDQPFTLGELDRVLGSVRSGSPGPDHVTYSMLKNLDGPAKLQLLEAFNRSYSEGTCPASWKTAKVFPLRKPAKPASDPSGYRPISLLSCVGKVMERLVLRRLLWHLDRLGLSCPDQWGFRAGRSTVEPLLRLVCDAKRACLDRQYTIVVFLDIRKAFDGVWHEAVMARLRLLGVSGLLYRWLGSFLAGRTYQLRVEDALSVCQPAVGVPQGSALSPRLFNLVMDGLGDCVPDGVQPGIFADDGTFWTSSASLQGASDRMQTALDSLSLYGDAWGLDISSEKTDFMIVGPPTGYGRPLPSANLTLKGRPIPQVRSKRILGLHLTDKLSWGEHVGYLRATCSKVVSLLFSLSGTSWGADRGPLLQLYKALGQSRLNYAAAAWPDLPAKLLASLETVQNSALRAITRLPRGTANAALQVETNVPSLKLQRELLTVRFLAKLKARFPALYASVSRPLAWFSFSPNRDPVTFTKESLMSWGVPEILDQVDREFLYSRLPPWVDGHDRISFDSQWLERPKESYPLELLRALTLEKIAGIPASEVVFTDGSRSPDPAACGLGVFWPKTGVTLSRRLPGDLCITTVELYAVLFAVRETPPSDHLLLCSDSQAALALLQDREERTTLVRTIKDTVLSRFRWCTFLWTPSHCGVPGNEAADRAAGAGLGLQAIDQVPLPRRDLDRTFARCSVASWTDLWASGTTGRILYSVKPTPGPWTYDLSLSKKECHALTSLRCGRAWLPDYLYKTNRMDSPDCDVCHVLGDVSHVLLACSSFDVARRSLRGTLDLLGVPLSLQNLLGNGSYPTAVSGKVVKATLEFLREIGFYDRYR